MSTHATAQSSPLEGNAFGDASVTGSTRRAHPDLEERGRFASEATLAYSDGVDARYIGTILYRKDPPLS